MKQNILKSTTFSKNTHTSENQKFLFLVLFSLAMMALSFALTTPTEIFNGLGAIFLSPSRLLTDYMEISSVGAAFFNASLLTLASLINIRLTKAKLTGPLIAAVLTIFGFALFGKNLYNSIPIVLGVFFYSKLAKQPFKDSLVPAYFGTSLGPVVSYLTFGSIGFPLWQGALLGYALGIFMGFSLVPLAKHFVTFHQGYSLYNMGFTAGIIGMIVVAVLNNLDMEITRASYSSSGNNLLFTVIMFAISCVFFLTGFFMNGKSMHGYKALLNFAGKSADFIDIAGIGVTAMNIGIMGVLSTAFVLVFNGQLNGPTLGGIFTVMGFSAYGKHPKNCLPIFAGVILGSFLNPGYTNVNGIMITALFGTTLAPVAHVYGAIYGVLAGVLHMSLVANVGFLHGGLNLYNNGFAGGFVAIMLIPIFSAINEIKKKRGKNSE